MPFAFDLLDEEQKKKEDQGADGSQGAPAMTGGGQSFGGGGGAPGGPSPAAEQKGTNTQGSGFVNLDKYMTANQGSGFGNQVTGKVQGDVSQAKDSLDSSAQGFTDASNKGATTWDNVGDTVKGIVDKAGSGTSPDDVANFQKYATAQYQGPESFTGSAYGTQAQGANTKATQEAKALQSEGGRFALLDQFYGRPNYNTGEKSLDNLLVQNTPGVAARSASLGSQANQLSGQMGQTQQQLDNLVASNKASTQDTAKQTRDYLTGANSNFNDQLNSELQTKQKSNSDAYQQMLQRLQENSLTDDDYNNIGFGSDTHIYDVDPTKYISQGQDASIYNTASADEYARAKALAQLSGEDDSALLPSEYADQAGKTPSPYNFDSGAFRGALNSEQAAYNQAGGDFKDAVINSVKSRGFDTADMASQTPEQILASFNSDPNKVVYSDIQKALDDYRNSIRQYSPDRTLGSSTGHAPLGGIRKRT